MAEDGRPPAGAAGPAPGSSTGHTHPVGALFRGQYDHDEHAARPKHQLHGRKGGGFDVRHEKDETSLSLEGGIGAERTQSSRHEVVDPEGEVARAKEDRRSLKAGIVMEDGKLGVGASGRHRTETEADGAKRATERDGSVKLTDEGMEAEGSLTKEAEKGGLKRSFSSKGGVSLNVEARPIPGTLPLKYTVTTTLRASLSLGGGGGPEAELDKEGKKENAHERADALGRGEEAEEKDDEPKAGLSASVGVSGSAALSHTRVLSGAELDLYLDAAERAEAGNPASGEYPELGHLAKLNLLASEIGRGAGAGDAAAVVGGASSAAAMAPGESQSLVLRGKGELKGGGEVGGEALGVGVEGSASMSLSREVKVAAKNVEGRDVVEVTVRFLDETDSALGASGKLAGGGAGHERSRGKSDESAAVFLLDPKDPGYSDAYAKIVGAWTRAQLDAVAKDPELAAPVCDPAHRQRLVSRTVGTGDHEGRESSFDVHGVGLSLGKGSSGSHRTTEAAGGVTDTFSGEGSTESKLGVKKTPIVSAGNRTEVEATVGPDNEVSAEMTNERESKNLLSSLWDWLVSEDPSSGHSLERLERELKKAHTHLAEVKLSPDDVDVLVERAGDRDTWMKCARSPRILEPWLRLGAELVSPHPGAEWEKIDPVRAAALARAQALAAFMRNDPDATHDAVHFALARYGERVGDAGAAVIGEASEWPSSLARVRDTLERTEELLEHAGPADARTHAATLATIATAVQLNQDFDSPAVKASMLVRIDRLRAEAMERAGAGAGEGEAGEAETAMRARRIYHRQEADLFASVGALLAQPSSRSGSLRTAHALEQADMLHKSWPSPPSGDGDGDGPSAASGRDEPVGPDPDVGRLGELRHEFHAKYGG